MTLGQLNIHKWLSRSGAVAYGMQFRRVRPGPGVGVADFAEALSVLLTRHEGLRTHYLPDRRQRVVDSGELPLRVLEVDDTDPADLDRVLDDAVNALPYDPATDLPVSAAVAVADGRVLAGVLRCSHLAADHKAMVVLGAEVEEMLADPAARVVGPPRHQPVDQAEAEQRPSMRRRAEASLRYWGDRLRRMPPNPLACPSSRGPGESGLGEPGAGGPGAAAPGPGESCAAEMVSHAGAAALARIEARTSLDRSTIVLAAVLAVLSERTGYSTHTFCALSNNRFFDRRLTDYVGTLAISNLVEVDCLRATFDELGERVRAGMVRASMNALYNAYDLHAIAERVEHERGVAFNYFPPIFNNAANYFRSRPAGDGGPAATPPTEFTWRPMESTPAPLRFDLWRIDEVLVLDGWTGDADRIGRAEVEAVLLAVERLLVAAADHDLDGPLMSAAIDLPPVPRGEGWLFVDSCWVRLAEAQQLLDDVFGPGRARLFGEVGGRPLVAYVEATEAVGTPEEAHARCLSRLSAHPTAMAPRHYVLCEGAATDPDEPSSWQRRRVVGRGSGRLAGG
ncbi:hypothetical protein [Saccharothrix xinjiangensis]|uniref:Condensation domain-containing protein n=1 Tax=Saccharothrix xinjiangensis TaxID=204798 RepID=A0ABV9Y0B3_9PSEU